MAGYVATILQSALRHRPRIAKHIRILADKVRYCVVVLFGGADIRSLDLRVELGTMGKHAYVEFVPLHHHTHYNNKTTP